MKGKILLIRIALIAAIGSLLFAIVTLIRAIVRGQGEMIAAVSVVGSVFVTVMCAYLFSLTRNYQEYSEDEAVDGDEDESEAEDAAPESPAPVKRAPRPQSQKDKNKDKNKSKNQNKNQNKKKNQHKPAREAQPSRAQQQKTELPAPPEADAPRSDRDIEAEIDRLLAQLEEKPIGGDKTE